MKGLDNLGLCKNKKMSVLCLGAVVLMLIVYTVICYIIIDNYSDTPEKVTASSNPKKDSLDFINSEEEDMFAIPILKVENNSQWGDQECVYAFIINKGEQQQLTEITDHQFLHCEGAFSMLSSKYWDLKKIKENTLISYIKLQ